METTEHKQEKPDWALKDKPKFWQKVKISISP